MHSSLVEATSAHLLQLVAEVAGLLQAVGVFGINQVTIRLRDAKLSLMPCQNDHIRIYVRKLLLAISDKFGTDDFSLTIYRTLFELGTIHITRNLVADSEETRLQAQH